MKNYHTIKASYQIKSISFCKNLNRKKQVGMSVTNSRYDNAPPSSLPCISIGKRQRIFNIMKNTKDYYLPVMVNTLNNVKINLSNHYNDENTGNNLLNQELNIRCYPLYTKRIENGEYETQIRGLVYNPGIMNRKNKLIYSICKQFLRPNIITQSNFDPEQQLDSVMESPSNDSSSTLESISSNPSSSSLVTGWSSEHQEHILKERISGFLDKPVANIPIIIDLSDKDNRNITLSLTDSLGQFSTIIKTTFLPLDIQVSIDLPSLVPISSKLCSKLIADSGYGLISDIDDTIKHTGIMGDKRSIFCNIFINDFDTWSIPGMSLWYNTLKHMRSVDFFYVSNSPFQIFSLLSKYIGMEFPQGPLFLKQYSGNLLRSIMTSSAKRKLGSIMHILNDFPNKKFIFVGDSGEQDLEAYVEAAKRSPTQIIGIYIRSCKDSMSDDPLREFEVMNELNCLIKIKFYDFMRLRTNKIPDIYTVYDHEVSKHKKKPPCVPKNKPKLSKLMEEEIANSKISPPLLPPRKLARLTLREPESSFCSATCNVDSASYDICLDKRAELWKQRVSDAIDILIENNINIRFMFFKDPELSLEDSINKINSLA